MWYALVRHCRGLLSAEGEELSRSQEEGGDASVEGEAVMALQTVTDLTSRLAALHDTRVRQVYWLARDPSDVTTFKKLAELQSVIAAFEAVIEVGASEPEFEVRDNP